MKKVFLFVIAALGGTSLGLRATGQLLPQQGGQAADTSIVPVKIPYAITTDTLDVTLTRRLPRPAKIKEAVPPAETEAKKKPIVINCGCGLKPGPPPAIYIDGKLADNSILKAFDQNTIESIHIEKDGPFKIGGKTYLGEVHIKTRGNVAL